VTATARQPLWPGEAHALILACETPREKLVVLGLIETGLPANEFSRLTSGDVNWHNATVCAPGTNVPVQVSAMLLRLLRGHFDHAVDLGIGNRQIQRIVRLVGHRAGLKKDISPDILRRTKYWNSVSNEAKNRGSRVLLEAANAAPDVILIADDERRYVDLNRAASEALGLPREAIIGRRIEEFFSEPGGEPIPATWSRLLADGEQFGVRQLRHGSAATFEYRAKANFVPGLHVSILRLVPGTYRKRSPGPEGSPQGSPLGSGAVA
jgi:PAS domain S-box-containing protein